MSRPFFKNPWIKWPLITIVVGTGLFFGLYGSIYLGLWGKVPSEKELSGIKQIQSSQVFDRDSTLIGKFYITDREEIEFKDLPKDLIHALIATEDARFYSHNGVDERSLLRVFFKTLMMGDRSSGGGSTITLQLAKNLYGRGDYGPLSLVINKLRESIVARRLENIYNKQEILMLYFNTVPFSGNTYGIESAAQKFFGTSTKNLSISQAATLVGTLKANHSYNPRLFPERSQLRRDVVLNQMVKYHYLSEQKAAEVMAHKIKIDYHNYSSSSSLAPYFKEQVKHRVAKILQQKKYHKPDGSLYNLKTDGLKIYTTLDAQLQSYAENAMRERMVKLQQLFEKSYGSNPPWRAHSPLVQKAVKNLPVYKKLKADGLSPGQIEDSLSKTKETELFGWKENTVRSVSTIDSLRHYLKFLNTGLLSIDPNNGSIRAYIGGIDYRYFQYDHVAQSRREVGSTFKPFVYTAALENGLKPCDYFPVREVTYSDQKDWTPKNANVDIDPDMNYSLTAALSHSINTIAVKVLRETGIDQVIDQVHKMGIDQQISHDPAIALGTSDVRLIDMAKAYSSFLNKGKPVQPYFINKITDKHGKTIVEFTPKTDAEQAFSENTRQIMLEILQDVVNNGTSRRLRNVYHFRNDIAGKTGTTQDNTDGWFIGLLPHLVTVTWVGNDNHNIKFKTTALGQGANSALPIFAGLLRQMNRDKDFDYITKAKFDQPSARVRSAMNCPPKKRNGFLKRLFHKNKTEKSFEKKKKKKKGFFGRLFGGSD